MRDQPHALTTGPTDAKIAVVSRSPGYHEAQAGKPFSGPAGKLLNHLLKENGVDRSDVLTTNVVLCYTDNPPREAIAACKPRLESELQHADTIILCGSEASKAIAGVRVNEGRGYSYDYRGARAIVTNNPAAALRDDSTFPNLVKDFRRAINPVPPTPFPTVRWTEDVDESLHGLPDSQRMYMNLQLISRARALSMMQDWLASVSEEISEQLLLENMPSITLLCEEKSATCYQITVSVSSGTTENMT